MVCESCNSRLSAYLDGNLSSKELRAVGTHIAACRRCREDLRELQDLKRILRKLPAAEAREGFWDDALRAVRTSRRKPAIWAYGSAVGAAAAAVAVAIIVLISRPDPTVPVGRIDRAIVMTINPVSLISLHTRERARSPLVDVAKVRIAGSMAEAADLADNGRFDVQ
jgi:predicted anti-sigma-YlaC factor YlaD